MPFEIAVASAALQLEQACPAGLLFVVALGCSAANAVAAWLVAEPSGFDAGQRLAAVAASFAASFASAALEDVELIVQLDRPAAELHAGFVVAVTVELAEDSSASQVASCHWLAPPEPSFAVAAVAFVDVAKPIGGSHAL